MTDKQIFENEIKCIIRRNEGVCNGGSDCIKCDLLMDSEEILKCYNRAIQNIDLIDRQKEENEGLKIDLAKCSIRIDNLYETADEIKSEAYKECLARVKNYIKTHCNAYGKPDFDYDTSIKILNFIDDLQKQRKAVRRNETFYIGRKIPSDKAN